MVSECPPTVSVPSHLLNERLVFLASAAECFRIQGTVPLDEFMDIHAATDRENESNHVLSTPQLILTSSGRKQRVLLP